MKKVMDQNYLELCGAIVGKAVEDWSKIKNNVDDDGLRRDLSSEMSEFYGVKTRYTPEKALAYLEEFFESDWCKTLCNMDKDQLMILAEKKTEYDALLIEKRDIERRIREFKY